jgi:hypothetical protein
MPFEVETYTPVTVENIEERADCSVTINPTNEEMEKLSLFLDELDNGKFHPKKVRLKIEGIQTEPIFFDRFGAIQKGQKNLGRLSKNTFSLFQELIDNIVKRGGCDPYQRPS